MPSGAGCRRCTRSSASCSSSNKNKAGGMGASSCRPSLRATLLGARGSPALLRRADQHHRRRWLLALGSPRVNEKSPSERACPDAACARSSDERRVGQDTLWNEKPKEATGNTLLATVERSQRLRKWSKALRSSDRVDGRTIARWWRDGSRERRREGIGRGDASLLLAREKLRRACAAGEIPRPSRTTLSRTRVD